MIRSDQNREKGIALVYVGVFLVPLLLCTGLAVDLGRGYLVRVALAKAVDAAALAAARNLNGDTSLARAVANNIFNANFPAGFLGATVPPDMPQVNFTIGQDGSNLIAVYANATSPTTFMQIARFDNLTVAASATATRRLVDMSFVIDRSGSLQHDFPAVKAAAKTFVGYFNESSDRIALITFSSNVTVIDPMPAARGFTRAKIQSDIDAANTGGPTSTAEALYQAWDQLRSVPSDSQSGLRIVVLFTDGSPNAFPGQFRNVATTCPDDRVRCPGSVCEVPQTDIARLSGSLTGTICAIDYPSTGNPSTTNQPYTVGLYQPDAATVSAVPPTNVNVNDHYSYKSCPCSNPQNPNVCIPYLPLQNLHGFSLGPTLPDQRTLMGATAQGYPNHAQNTYNAARNLAETVADAIRRDETSGRDHRIRIYTLGLGDLLTQPLGSTSEGPQTGAEILRRIANEPGSRDYDSTQLDGKYYSAGNPTDLNAAFEAVRDQIVRLTQ